MASIHVHQTAKGERRYDVRYRDQQGKQRSRFFSVRKDAQAFRLEVERRRQAGELYQAAPEPFSTVAQAWLERYTIGAAGRVRPRPKSILLAEDTLKGLDPLAHMSIDRIHRPLVDDVIASIAADRPRQAEMALALLKRVLRWSEERGQQVDRAIYGVRIAKPSEREPQFLTWDEAEELRSWIPEHTARIVPIAIFTHAPTRRDPRPARLRHRFRGRLDRSLLPTPGRRTRIDEDARRSADGRRRAGCAQASPRAAARPRAEPRWNPLPEPDGHAMERAQLLRTRLQARRPVTRASLS